MRCRVRGCGRNHPPSMLMCSRCWASLPARLQERMLRVIHEVDEANVEAARYAWRRDRDESYAAHVSLAINHARDFQVVVFDVAWWTRHGAWPPAELVAKARLTKDDEREVARP